MNNPNTNTPDVLVSIFTDESQRVNVYNNNFGWGWATPFWGINNVSTTREVIGILYIDIIDFKTKELLWQGSAKGSLNTNRDRKIKQIDKFVFKILKNFPTEQQ